MGVMFAIVTLDFALPQQHHGCTSAIVMRFEPWDALDHPHLATFCCFLDLAIVIVLSEGVEASVG